MIRLVLFDIDGTLVHTGRAGVRAFAKVFETEFGFRGAENMKFAGRTDTGLVREFFVANGVQPTPEHFQQFFGSYVFWLHEMLQESSGGMCPGVVGFLRELQQLDAPPLIGLLTGNIRLGAEIKLRHFDLWKEFRTGGFADDHEDRNQIAVIARERGVGLLDEPIRPEQVLVIGDTPLDVKCGRAINARVLAVATGGANLAELKTSRPDWVVNDLTQISAAAVCCRNGVILPGAEKEIHS